MTSKSYFRNSEKQTSTTSIRNAQIMQGWAGAGAGVGIGMILVVGIPLIQNEIQMLRFL